MYALRIRHLRCFWYSKNLSDCLPSFRQSSCYSSILLRNSTLFWTHKILSSLIELVSFAEIFFYHCHHLKVHNHLLSFDFQETFDMIIVLSVPGCKIYSNRKNHRGFPRFYATVLSGILLAYHSWDFLWIRESQRIWQIYIKFYLQR